MSPLARTLEARLALLLLGALLLPAAAWSQQENPDLGIVSVRYVSIVVRDYDEALRWYTGVLGLEKVEDGSFGKGKRWLVVAPRGRKDVGIILELAKPYAPNDSIRNYKARIGKETRWVFEVEDCHRFYELASKRGVKFVETPVDRPAGIGRDWGVTEAMFEDLYGNVFVVESRRKK